MTQSALGGALKPVPSVDNSAETNYQDALDRIKMALDAREKKAFDPVLLAMAQGFLAPTKTGSFGESLGQAAGAVLPVQQQQEKEAMENAQFRLQLAQAEREQANLTAAQRAFGQAAGLGGGAGGAGAAGGAGGEGAAAGGAGDFQPVSLQNAMKFVAAFPNQKELGARMMEAAKAGLDRFAMSMNGIVFDKMTGKYLNVDIPGQTQSDYATPYGTFKMLPNEYSRFTMAQKAGMGKEWMDAFKKGEQFGVDQLVAQKMEGKAPTAPIKKPVDGEKAAGEPGGRMTVSEQEAQAAAAKKEAEKGAESRADQTAAVRAAGKAATGLLPIYDRAESILNRKDVDIKKVMGVLERGDVMSALGSFAEEALRIGQFNVGIPAIRKVLAQSGAPQDVIDAAAELGQLLAITQFEQRKGLGNGTSVSNFEQQMVNAMGPTMQDTLGSFTQKLSFLKEKAKFESELWKAMYKSKMQYEDFEHTDEFRRIFDAYRKRITGIVYPGSKPSGQPAAQPAKTSGPAGTVDELVKRRDALRNQLNQ